MIVGLHTTDLMAIAQGIYRRMGFVRVPEHDIDVVAVVTIIAFRLDLRAQ